MTRLLILGLLLGMTHFSQSQEIEEKAQNYLQSFQIDSFIIYSLPCSGRMPSIDSCSMEETHYLIWKLKGEYYIKKIDYCQNYNAIQLSETNPLTFYITNKQQIDKEKVRPPTYYDYKKTIKGIDTVMTTISVNHTCSHKLILNLKNRVIIKYANSYYIDFAKFDNGKKNIYYNYNRGMKLKALIDKISGLINKLDMQKEFNPE